jgi:pimeloyl-ACP methyl ester carboxylesterase
MTYAHTSKKQCLDAELANANLWRGVVDALHNRFRCIAIDLSPGAYLVPMPVEADLGPDSIAAVIAAVIATFLRTLDLSDVTLVGNDSGGAYSQIAVARHTDRLARLVQTSCETSDDQRPPPPFDYWPPRWPRSTMPSASRPRSSPGHAEAIARFVT